MRAVRARAANIYLTRIDLGSAIPPVRASESRPPDSPSGFKRKLFPPPPPSMSELFPHFPRQFFIFSYISVKLQFGPECVSLRWLSVAMRRLCSTDLGIPRYSETTWKQIVQFGLAARSIVIES